MSTAGARFAEGRFAEKESNIEPAGGEPPVTPLPQSWPAPPNRVFDGPRLLRFAPCFRRQHSAENLEIAATQAWMSSSMNVGSDGAYGPAKASPEPRLR